MPFTDHCIAKAPEIFISSDDKLQKELANLSRHSGGLYVEELRMKHAQAAYLNAVEEQGRNPMTLRCAFSRERRRDLRKLCVSNVVLKAAASEGTYLSQSIFIATPTTAPNCPVTSDYFELASKSTAEIRGRVGKLASSVTTRTWTMRSHTQLRG